MYCSKCGQQFPDGTAFCSSCGSKMNVQDSSEQQETPQQSQYIPQYDSQRTYTKSFNSYKKWYQRTGGIILLLILFFPVGIYLMWRYANWNRVIKIIISAFFGILFIAQISTAETTQPNESEVIVESSTESVKELSEESSNQIDSDIDEGLLKIIQYHKEKLNGTESESALKGKETAFNINLGLYKSNDGKDSLKYLTYYYALKGEDDFITEFGEDRLTEISSYVKALDTEGIVEKAFEVPKLTLEQFQELAESPTFEDLSRYPDTYKITPIKVTVYVKDVDTDKWLGMMQGGYLCTMNGQEIVVFDNRSVKEPRLLKGDTVTIYGYGGGLYKRQSKQQGLILDKVVDEWYSPEVRIEYVVIQ